MTILFIGLAAVLLLSLVVWAFSVLKKDVSIVDNFWGVFFAVLFASYMYPMAAKNLPLPVPTLLMAAALGAWVLRYSVYIYFRNHGKAEDYRYATIRQNWNPGFWWKSLFMIFLFQAALTWVLSGPFYMATQSYAQTYCVLLSYAGCGLSFFGLLFEAVADFQLNRFKQTSEKGQVMDKGLWRYSRHPNYFGQSCLWFGFAFIAIGYTGAWSLLYAPVLMTWLLLKFSGVSLMESTITERRPAYKDYMARTSAFVPWLPKQ